jgi:hypothetical protein
MKIKLQNKLTTLDPGDRIVVPITQFGMAQHHAIYFGQINGVDFFIENKIGFGVRLITANQFFIENQVITRIEKFLGDRFDRAVAIQKAQKMIGNQYDLLTFNCEHFANEIQRSISTSPQVKVGIALGILSLFLLITIVD